jgi:hypothetical protein
VQTNQMMDDGPSTWKIQGTKNLSRNQVGESGVIWTGFCFSRVGPFLII